MYNSLKSLQGDFCKSFTKERANIRVHFDLIGPINLTNVSPESNENAWFLTPMWIISLGVRYHES